MLSFLARIEPSTIIAVGFLRLKLVCWLARVAVAVPDAIEERTSLACLAVASDVLTAVVAHGGSASDVFC